MSSDPKRRRFDGLDSASAVKVTEISAAAFRAEIDSDVQKMIPAILDRISDLNELRYVWQVEPVGVTIVIKPKEEEIDATRLFPRAGGTQPQPHLPPPLSPPMRAIKAKGVRSGSSSLAPSSPEYRHGDDSNSGFDYEDSARSESAEFERLEQKLNLDTLAALAHAEEKFQPPLPSPWLKAQEAKARAKRTNRLGIERPIKGIGNKVKLDLIKRSRTAIRIVRDHPDEAVAKLRQWVGKRTNDKLGKDGEPLLNNPPWAIRIVTALFIGGPMKEDKITRVVEEQFMRDRPTQIRPHNNEELVSTHLAPLMAAKVVVFAKTAREQIFKLSDFILDEGNSESPKTRAIANNIARVFDRQLFVDVLDEMTEVVDTLNVDKIHEIISMHVWNAEFPDASLAQMATAAILFQGVGDGYVPLSDVKTFVEECFLEEAMDARLESELVAVVNSLHSMGALEGVPEGYKVFDDLDLIRLIVSNMFTSELFDLHPPPMNLINEQLLILTYYIMDPQRTSVDRLRAVKFMETRLCSTWNSGGNKADRKLTSPRFDVGMKRALLHGVVECRSGRNHVLSNAMFDSLDKCFKKKDEGVGYWDVGFTVVDLEKEGERKKGVEGDRADDDDDDDEDDEQSGDPEPVEIEEESAAVERNEAEVTERPTIDQPTSLVPQLSDCNPLNGGAVTVEAPPLPPPVPSALDPHVSQPTVITTTLPFSVVHSALHPPPFVADSVPPTDPTLAQRVDTGAYFDINPSAVAAQHSAFLNPAPHSAQGLPGIHLGGASIQTTHPMRQESDLNLSDGPFHRNETAISHVSPTFPPYPRP